MAKYRYAGPGPDESSGELVHPGDVREFDAEPDWGPWECIDPPPEPEAAEVPAPAPPGPFSAPPVTPEGNM